MSTWHLALRWLGLRDRAERRGLPRSPLYWTLKALAVGALVVVCFLVVSELWIWMAVTWALAVALIVAAGICRDRDSLREARRSSRARPAK